MRTNFRRFVLSSRLASTVVGGFALVASTSLAHALVHVSIDLSSQRMHVESDEGSYDWPISSARSGFSTPGGSFAPTHLELMHYSKKYHMAPMPHAIFFRGGYAIHGTYETSDLGRPASHGCVRLSPGNAASLYAMVKAEGARISISGTPPASRPFAVARHRGHHEDTYADGAPDAFYGDQDDGGFYGARSRRRADGGSYYGQAGYGYYPPAPRGYHYVYPTPTAQSGMFSGYDE